MSRIAFAVLIIFCCAAVAAAQSDEYARVEVFGGFSHNQVEGVGAGFAGEDGREGFNGFEASVVGNLTRYVGLKFDVAGHYRGEREADVGICVDATTGGVCFTPRVRASLYNFLGGVQFKDNAREGRVKPFAHLLVGAGRLKVSFDDSACREALGFPCLSDQTETGLSGAVGGGLDLRVSERVDVRAVQLDYNPTRLGDRTRHNLRVGAGVLIR